MLQAIEKREGAVDAQPSVKDLLSFPERVSFGGLLARSIGEMLRPGGELAGVGLEVSGIQRARSGGAFLEVAVSDGQALVLLYAASTAIAFKNGQGAMSALAAAWDANGRRLRRAARELCGALRWRTAEGHVLDTGGVAQRFRADSGAGRPSRAESDARRLKG